jgi:hypothetical protein
VTASRESAGLERLEPEKRPGSGRRNLNPTKTIILMSVSLLAQNLATISFPDRIPPKMNTIESEIKARIETFVQELDLLIRKSTLEALKSVLATNGTAFASPTRRRGRPAGSGASKGARRGRRPAANVEAASDKILSHVQSNDGQSVSEIAAATGTPLPVAKKALSSLLNAGAVKKTGQKRGTRYHTGSGRARPAAARKTKKRAKTTRSRKG